MTESRLSLGFGSFCPTASTSARALTVTVGLLFAIVTSPRTVKTAFFPFSSLALQTTSSPDG